jgi:hypothetical protein
MAIEQLEDIIEEILDARGIYGAHEENTCKPGCPCRSHAAGELRQRILCAAELEYRHFLHEITAEDLLRRAVRGARDHAQRKGTKHPRWVAVSAVFALGSTYARELCRKFELNPDEQVR